MPRIRTFFWLSLLARRQARSVDKNASCALIPPVGCSARAYLVTLHSFGVSLHPRSWKDGLSQPPTTATHWQAFELTFFCVLSTLPVFQGRSWFAARGDMCVWSIASCTEDGAAGRSINRNRIYFFPLLGRCGEACTRQFEKDKGKWLVVGVWKVTATASVTQLRRKCLDSGT
jgi:hypothetical protein